MRVVMASKAATGKAHLAEFGEHKTLCGRNVTDERYGTVASEDRCKRCEADSAPDMWETGPTDGAVTAPSNRPADVPAVAPGTPVTVALSAPQIGAIERLFVGRLHGAHRTWVRQQDTGAVVILDLMGDAPSAEEIGVAIGERVHLTRDKAGVETWVEYRLARDLSWCRDCLATGGHAPRCRTSGTARH